eukprot:TRINITY_DN4063_c0_g1_i2.p1 TRINITY_DN4063_c0_g1~~TRINITY_DN4063_c0_g1_i2.p1  ORF type:complete len:2253 (-),score=629.40 TRINITY_DN4063_c0_g1_i2:1326-7811(-)
MMRLRALSEEEDRVDALFDFVRVTCGPVGPAYLLNVHPAMIYDQETMCHRSGVDCYFLGQNKETFKVTLTCMPYFYLSVPEAHFREIETELTRTFDYAIAKIEPVEREDLNLKNHLSGLRRTFMKVNVLTVQMLVHLRSKLDPIVQANKERIKASQAYEGFDVTTNKTMHSYLQLIEDIREYDIIYYQRVMIDNDLRVGMWYSITFEEGNVRLVNLPSMDARPDLRVLAYDIETTKQPLLFPNKDDDMIMMISYMIDRQGYLIVNRQIVSHDIENFEYTPKAEYPGPFHIFNEANEERLLQRFCTHIQEVKPHLFVTFNGDGFDWPFVEARANKYNISLQQIIGLRFDTKNEFYTSRHASHLDCFAWVQRDSYLPHGSQGLKAVTRVKLGYDPLELDPEDMTRLAREDPDKLTAYSVSDAVATYYLYMKHIHPFIYSLANVIPLNPDEVLRKGSGTLCEALLMAEAFKARIIFPNKVITPPFKFHEGHLIDNESYVGGHVEGLASGIFRYDLPCRFQIPCAAVEKLKSQVDDIIAFAAKEGQLDIATVTNLAEVKRSINAKLDDLVSVGRGEDGVCRREETPVIVHVDVAAMYPNIILTYRLQPSAIVNDEICAACIFNSPENNCKRPMPWQWRADMFKATYSEFQLMRAQLENEVEGFLELKAVDQEKLIKEKLKKYCQKVYAKVHFTEPQMRTETVCMRENPFYVDTVRAFRDRRYIYKNYLKTWKNALEAAARAGDASKQMEAEAKLTYYDSMQLAHKCILNSFYGYVMRKGSRWMSMEMAGIVTHTGFQIITMSRELISCFGRPVELDTDGIWCLFPKTFPSNYLLESPTKKFAFNFPCTTLNRQVHQFFSNNQYERLVGGHYEANTECTIGFEVDGPYRAIFLPASKEEGKQLKKRYAVYHMDGSLAEMKGFEIKRRGELKLIKTFQSEVFTRFLEGKTLAECYTAVAEVANECLTMLNTRGEGLTDEELLEKLTESSNMSRTLESYGKAKTCQTTTARRLGEFLPSVVQDKGLKCAYIIANSPPDAKVTERAVPVAIFFADPTTRELRLCSWLKKRPDEISLRLVIDWDYYRTRIESTIQKIITIPASLQGVPNPVPGVSNPLEKQQNALNMRNQTQLCFPTLKQLGKPQDSEQKEVQDQQQAEKKRPTEPYTGPDLDSNPQEWLRLHKKMWRELRVVKRHRQQRQLDSGQGEGAQAQAQPQATQLALRAFFTKQGGKHADITKHVWHVLSIAETITPGMFTLWAMVGPTIRSFTVTVPRIFYVNSLAESLEAILPPSLAAITKVGNAPPRGKLGKNMFEVAMPESTFVANLKVLLDLIGHTDVEGVYERQVPLVFRAVVYLGSTCKLKKSKKRRKDTTRFDLFTDLEPVGQWSSGYLGEPTQKMFLYHSGSDTRAAFCLFIPWKSRVVFCTVNPFDKAEANFTRYFATLKANVTTTRHPSMKDACKEINATLFELRSHAQGSSFIVFQSSTTWFNLANTQHLLPELLEFCCVPMPFNQAESVYPPLGWEAHLAKVVARKCVEFVGGEPADVCGTQTQATQTQTQKEDTDTWLEYQLKCARYANVPLGNMEADTCLFLADVLFARELQSSQCLLWVSGNNRPDLGGSEYDDNSGAEIANPVLRKPGCFRTVSVELSLGGIAECTAILIDKIHNLEGTSRATMCDVEMSGEGDNSAMTAADRVHDCSRQFRIMRDLIRRWFRDSAEGIKKVDGAVQFVDTKKGVEVAANLLDNTYRWVSSSNSLLYDPALHRTLHGIMNKIFMQLTLELQKLGARVVFANLTRIIINTDKTTLSEAEYYLHFVQKALAKAQQNMFAPIELAATQYWDVLLFVDEHNYCGVPCACDETTFISQWSIAEHFDKPFTVATSEFVQLVYNGIRKQQQQQSNADDHAMHTSVPDENAEEQSFLFGDGAEAEAAATATAQLQSLQSRPQQYTATPVITSAYTQKLFEIVKDIARSPFYAQQRGSTYHSYASSHDAALDFVRSLCYVLCLDECHARTVQRIQKGLLKQLKVAEFSLAQQLPPSYETYVLPNVFCTFCHSCRDIDLLRDTSLLRDNGWQCTSCAKPLNVTTVEAALVDVVAKRWQAYQTQDLQCMKCGTVKAESLVCKCPKCSGTDFVTRMPLEDTRKAMHIFGRIAEVHRFEWLKSVLEWAPA